jgi:hypothetical protein
MCFSFTWELRDNELEIAKSRNVTALDLTYCILKLSLITGIHL